MLFIGLFLIGTAVAQNSKPIPTEALVTTTINPTVPAFNSIVFTHNGEIVVVPKCPFGCPDLSKPQPQPTTEEVPLTATLPEPAVTLHLRRTWTTPCSPKKIGCEVTCVANLNNEAWHLEGNTAHQNMCLNGGYAPSEILK